MYLDQLDPQEAVDLKENLAMVEKREVQDVQELLAPTDLSDPLDKREDAVLLEK